MKNKRKQWAAALILMVSALVYTGCQPLREFEKVPVYNSTVKHDVQPVTYDPSKKTVVIVAHNEGTEIFDLMAPYYLFNVTQQANVYVVA
ncbi:hypothetical protein [Flavobacterium sp. XGLA_31]|uniref:hypothetical protein n=1 Tax=Flavobacterium sp. XGLA_31 TaxID=3447666 RepID=UPI003F3C6BA2